MAGPGDPKPERCAMDGICNSIEARRHCRVACRTPGHEWPGRAIRSQQRCAMDG